MPERRPEPEEQLSETYDLPQVIATALATGRTQFLDIAIAEMRRGQLKLSQEQGMELVRLLRDCIKDRDGYKQEARELEGKLKQALEGLSEASSRIRSIVKSLQES